MRSGSVRLHLVRHGHTDALGRVLSGRAPHVGLSERGRTEAAAQAATLAGRNVSAVFSSPQPRTRQTAQAIGDAIGLSVQTEPALDEVDFGAWGGETFESLDARVGWQAWNRLRSLAPSPGETMLAVQARATALVQRLYESWPDGELVLVSHADVIRVLLAYLLGVPIDLMQRIAVSPAGRSVVVLSGAAILVEAVNLLPPAR